MFGFGKPKCPVELPQRRWIERRMAWLVQAFGRDRLRGTGVILPRPEFFPDEYHGRPEDVAPMFSRVCEYMDLSPDEMRLQLYQRRATPRGQQHEKFAAGTYQEIEGKYVITL